MTAQREGREVHAIILSGAQLWTSRAMPLALRLRRHALVHFRRLVGCLVVDSVLAFRWEAACTFRSWLRRQQKRFLGHKFWARGYFVSTVGRDEEMIRAYIRNQEMADKQLDQLQMKLASS